MGRTLAPSLVLSCLVLSLVRPATFVLIVCRLVRDSSIAGVGGGLFLPYYYTVNTSMKYVISKIRKNNIRGGSFELDNYHTHPKKRRRATVLLYLFSAAGRSHLNRTAVCLRFCLDRSGCG